MVLPRLSRLGIGMTARSSATVLPIKPIWHRLRHRIHQRLHLHLDFVDDVPVCLS